MSAKHKTERAITYGKDRIQYLEERIQYLEEINRYTIDALEMAASIGDFQPNINKLQDTSILLSKTISRIQRLIQFQAIAFFLVDEETNDIFLAKAEPKNNSPYIQNEVDFLIENGIYAWALMERRAVIISSKDNEKRIILHVMATRSRIKGMFVGLMGEDADIPDISLSLLSIILLNSANAIKSFELYNMIRGREEALKQAYEELKNTQAQLIQSGKLASIGQLAAGVAHEINNPITFVMLNAPIFEKVWNSVTPILEEYCRSNGDFRVSGMSYTQLEERMPLLLKDIKEGAMRVKRIVEDLKDFARQGPFDLTAMVDVNSTIKAAVGLVSNQIKKSTDYFEVEYGLDIPKFKGNTQRIEQVIINLLVNACQALPDKERSIQISTAYDKESSNVLVQVRDQGVGMSAEVLQRIKDPFFTTNRESGGTGLGLVISERIIEDHCGTMKLDSSPGKGTTVTVSLPANPSSEGRNRDEEVK